MMLHNLLSILAMAGILFVHWLIMIRVPRLFIKVTLPFYGALAFYFLWWGHISYDDYDLSIEATSLTFALFLNNCWLLNGDDEEA